MSQQHLIAMSGYGGYRRNFERDMMQQKDTPPTKYDDFEVEQHSLMQDARWRSEYSKRHDAGKILSHQHNQPGRTTWSQPNHKDYLAARKIVENTKVTEEKEGWNWQAGIGSGGNSSSIGVAGVPSSVIPRAGRGRNLGSPVYGTVYGDSIGNGTKNAPPPVAPRYPNLPSSFTQDGSAAMLPALDSTLNKSLAQAIASLPAADNILKGNVDIHGSYARDYGHRGHHPLQRTAGHVGGPPVIHAGSITVGSANSAYTQSPATHQHIFPSSSLIGPSGAKAGPSPIEGINEYPNTSYSPSISADATSTNTNNTPNLTQRQEPGTAVENPFTKGSKIGDNLCEIGTTKELFAGSTKSAAIRVPGYAGFIPASVNNQLSLTGNQPTPNTKDHILQTFKHDMPGYTGHKPRSVVNVRGPRTPRGKTRMNEGLVASLILESMKI